MFELMDTEVKNANIKVIGVGGGGGNAVQNMLDAGIEGVDFICANTDAQALEGSDVKNLLQLGSSLTKGLGAGANPEVGRESALVGGFCPKPRKGGIRGFDSRGHRRQFKTKVVESKSELAVRKLLLHNGLCD